MQLAISTATAACSVALLDGENILAEEHRIVGRGHAECLISMIAGLPNRGRASMIWVDCGPGSFTGVRVGLAAARALALAWEVPLFGFSTLALVAAGLRGAGEPVGIAIQGGHGELFLQDFETDPLHPTTELASLTPTEGAGFIRSRMVAGSGSEALIAARGHGTAHDLLPRAADARWLPETLRTLAPSPIYGRAPDAVPL